MPEDRKLRHDGLNVPLPSGVDPTPQEWQRIRTWVAVNRDWAAEDPERAAERIRIPDLRPLLPPSLGIPCCTTDHIVEMLRLCPKKELGRDWDPPSFEDLEKADA